MIRFFKILISAFACLCCTACLSQNNLPEMDLCNDLQIISTASFPVDPLCPDKEVRLSLKSRQMISQATLVSLSEIDDARVSGITDEDLLPDLFNTTAEAYEIVNLIPRSKSFKNVGILVICVPYAVASPTVLLTYTLKGKSSKCMEIINALVIQFLVGNNYWEHLRYTSLNSEDNIEIGGTCWRKDDIPEGDVSWKVIASVAPDGTITIKKIPTEEN